MVTNQLPHDRRSRPLRDLRISVTDRCNFRCPYCMPDDRFHEAFEFAKKAELLSFEEIERTARLFTKLGVRKIRLTGGEPLLRQGLPELLSRLSRLEGIEDVALTTNGQLLARQAQALADAGLPRVTVSLDSLDEELFQKLSGKRGSLGSVLEGLEEASRVGFSPIKLNTVLRKGWNDGEIIPLTRFARDRGYTIRFIEFMDVGSLNRWKLDEVVPSKHIRETLEREWGKLVPLEASHRGEVASRYRFEDSGAEVGFISSVSQPFCGDCNRARLSTVGQLYPCLFSSKGWNLRDLLRQGESDETVLEQLRSWWERRDDRYSEMRSPQDSPDHPSNDGSSGTSDRVEMYRMGG